MEVEAFDKNKEAAKNAIITKDVAYFNRLYYSLYLKDNTTIDPAIRKEHHEMLVGNMGTTASLPSPQKKRSISEVNNTASSSKQSVNNAKKKKGNDERKTSKIKVYTTSLFEKGLLSEGDVVLFKHDDKEVKCKVITDGDLEVYNADKSEKKVSNNLRIIIQYICEAYNLSQIGKSKYWNLFYLATKNGSKKLKSLREEYLALQGKGADHTGREEKKRRRRKQAEDKKNTKLSITHLIGMGLLKDGQKVIYRGQKNTFQGKITGSRYITYYDPTTKREESFETPNSFKSHIGELGNCWQQMVLVDGERETSFQTIRDKYFE